MDIAGLASEDDRLHHRNQNFRARAPGDTETGSSGTVEVGDNRDTTRNGESTVRGRSSFLERIISLLKFARPFPQLGDLLPQRYYH